MLWMWFLQSWCKVEKVTSNSQPFRNVNTMTSQKCANVASKLTSEFISQYFMHVVMTTTIQRCKHRVKFNNVFRRRCYDVAPSLCQFCQWCQNIDLSWSHTKIITLISKLWKHLTAKWYLSGILGQYHVMSHYFSLTL